MILKANIADSLGYYLRLRDRIVVVVIVIAIFSMAAATFVSLILARNFEKSDKEYAAFSLQFVQVEKMATVGRLAAGIAHEINNPLQMITNQAGWIGELLPDEDPALVKNMAGISKGCRTNKASCPSGRHDYPSPSWFLQKNGQPAGTSADQ